jgi:tripartite-type tricarboxylate transporter receptor subunit TctC
VHFSGELFKAMTDVDMVHIPYKGAAPAMTDLVGGQVQLMFDFLSAALPQIKAGKLRPLGVTSATRSPLLPEVPTIAEAGVPGYQVLGNFGIFAPAGTPTPVIERLNKDLAEQAATPELQSTEEFQKSLKAEVDKWARIVKATGGQLD